MNGTGAVMVVQGDARAIPLADNSVDAIVTDPPYGLEFMGQEWDKLTMPKPGNLGGFADGNKPSFSRTPKVWMTGAGKSKPGIGERQTEWPSFGSGAGANPTCLECGGRMRGKKKCACEQPDWRVDGERFNASAQRISMGQAMQAWHYAWASEALRVAKPGAHLVAFGGTRTHHRLMCALEDAGWEIRDCCMWLYGSGFPKSLDVSKAIDKAAGAERETAYLPHGGNKIFGEGKGKAAGVDRSPGAVLSDPPVSDAAHEWSGWGTALKPAWEPIILARKPLSERNVAANVLKWGTGALNIDVSRIHSGPSDGGSISGETAFGQGSGWNQHNNRMTEIDRSMASGRWPANLILDEEASAMLDEQSGELTSGANPTQRHSDITRGIYGAFKGHECFPKRGADSGGASRFFYCSKADRAEREIGMDGVEAKPLHWSSGDKNPGSFQAEGTAKQARNNHPTVKPIGLMLWLCRLVTPVGGLILDLFMGSGSTGIAALRCGFRFIGFDKDQKWVSVAERRIIGDAPLLNQSKRPPLGRG